MPTLHLIFIPHLKALVAWKMQNLMVPSGILIGSTRSNIKELNWTNNPGRGAKPR